ncbi:paraneoplastic antigen Ma1 homolog [Xyrauchen texanus]|uniref:paraneoplastic antigen Ma1 homolog n=1 Tax=Xyrauchen texanus TaxID=154827 RepID=UPI002241BE13|nr:paraneoplastic antigen Ma1 homolog [Xyrauchen texanus]
MDLSKAGEWSSQVKLDPNKCVILHNVPIDMTEDIISEVLNSVKVFGCPKLRGRRGDITGSQMFLLVETSLEIDVNTVPLEVGIPGVVGPWGVHVPAGDMAPELTEKGSEFQEKLMSWLNQEGKSLDDVRPLISIDQPTNVNANLVHALDRLVEKCTQAPVESLSYRKLRVFSGLQPVPSGEDDYDSWMEQATQMVSEWQCAESTKKQRIVESLRGPAADIVRFVKMGSSEAAATDYLKALDTAYGSTESETDLTVKFSCTYQEPGEKLSSYLYRLDKILHRLFLKGGIKVEDLNRKRMEQVVKGALTSDTVALRLRMMYSLRDPPGFSQLLREVREEENWISTRISAKPVVNSKPAVAVPMGSALDEVEILKREVKDLTTQVGKLLKNVTSLPVGDVTTQIPCVGTAKASGCSTAATTKGSDVISGQGFSVTSVEKMATQEGNVKG